MTKLDDVYPTNAADAAEERWRLMGLRRGDSGIYRGYGGSAALSAPGGMVTRVAAGAGVVHGIEGEWANPINLTHADAHATQNRWDLVVLSLHKDVTPYELHVELLQGANSSGTAAVPSLRNSATRIDVEIGRVEIPASLAAVSTDEQGHNRQWAPAKSPWAAYVPNVAAASGSSFTIASYVIEAARWRYNGQNIDIFLLVSFSITGTPTGFVDISLPFAARDHYVPLSAYGPISLQARTAVTSGNAGADHVVLVPTYDGATPAWPSGLQPYSVAGSYETLG